MLNFKTMEWIQANGDTVHISKISDVKLRRLNGMLRNALFNTRKGESISVIRNITSNIGALQRELRKRR